MTSPAPETYDDLRTAFTAAVSHELRTPLARIASLLESALLEGSDTAGLIARARSEVGELAHLVDEVLFLSELESGDSLVGAVGTPVAAVIAHVFSELRERAEVADVELRGDADPKLELPLRRRLVRVVVENLAENAIRHAGAGAVFTLSASAEGDRVLIVGADTGVGVPRSDLPRIFERFFRSDRSRGSAGSGLGLAIVKHIVTAAGGTVVAGNRRGGGLVVRCEFPLVPDTTS